MSEFINAELAATCDALGYLDKHTYHLDANALSVIKDLIKYLKRDDDTHTVRRYLGSSSLLQSDLIYILAQHKANSELWDVLLRLMINLTSPALMMYNDELPTEKTSRSHYLELVRYLQGYKRALVADTVWVTINSRMSEILAIETMERGEENELVLERILTFIRNVLQVPPDDNDKRVENDATVHDELLFALHASGIVDLLLFIASKSSEQQYHMQIVEIVGLMLREQNANKLARVGLQRTGAEKQQDEKKLLTILRKESAAKMEKVKKYASTRHSRFGGTFVVQNMKAIGENQLICHKTFHNIEALDFGHDKGKVKKAKNRVLLEPESEERTSVLSVRLFLKEFCVEFLIGAYNPVMRYAKSCIIGESHAEKSEARHYLWALRFFMEFNRHYKFQVKYVSETISTEIFYLVQRQLELYYEMMVTDKKKIPLWSSRLHLALKAYQELLHTLSAMDKTADKGVRDSSKVIKSNVFYVPEYRETILSQLLCYDRVKMSRQYLVDLVTTVHIFLKMLEQFCAQGQAMIVAKRKKKRAKAKKKAAKEALPSEVKSLEDRWDEYGPELSAVMQEGTIPDVVPFDAALDTPIDDQKSDAMKRIQRLLRRKEFEEAIGLLRAAREVWPENDCFGRRDIPAEEEFLALKEIFFADLGVVEVEPEKDEQTVENFLNNENTTNELDEEENEEDSEPEVHYEETNFNFKEFINRFANIKVVKAIAILLRTFQTNSMEINRYVVKMLHRIAWDCKMSGMIFQASIFRDLQKILESKLAEHQELQKFAVFIIRQFVETAEKNRKAYMELLFWKNTREATELVEGYDVETESKKVSRAVWSEAEEDELRTLFMEHQTNKYPQDLIDWLQENLINEDRTRRGIIKKLREMHLVVNSKQVRDAVQKRLPKEWAEEEIAELTEMWENVKDDQDPVATIHEGLRIKRPKAKIKEKLLELGLAKDRKELRKKRKKKNHGEPRASWQTQSASEASDDNSSDDENVQRPPKVPTSNKKIASVKRRKKPRKIVYTEAQLAGLFKDLLEKNMNESLEWIKESLEEALEDRDEESSDGIPLVPVTDYSSTAMDSPSFQRLLRAIGIEPPADEQETYWRIPATMLSSTIRKRCEMIKNALDGNLIINDSAALETARELSSSEDSGNEATSREDLEQVKRMFDQEKSKFKSIGEKSPLVDLSSSEEEVPPVKSRKKALAKPIEATSAETNEIAEKSKLNLSRIKAIEDSSDSEAPEEETSKNAEPKRGRTEVESDAETPVPKKRRVIDSDDETDDEKLTKLNSKVDQLIRMLSDDDDDD